MSGAHVFSIAQGYPHPRTSDLWQVRALAAALLYSVAIGLGEPRDHSRLGKETKEALLSPFEEMGAAEPQTTKAPARRRGILSLLRSSGKRGLDVVSDGSKLTVDRTGKAIQPSDGNERDQGSDQSIFDEVLTGLITYKAGQQRFRAIQRSLLTVPHRMSWEGAGYSSL